MLDRVGLIALFCLLGLLHGQNALDIEEVSVIFVTIIILPFSIKSIPIELLKSLFSSLIVFMLLNKLHFQSH